MENLDKSMKLSLIFGPAGALLLPIFYEIYANISSFGALILMMGWVIFAGVRFSSLKFREAFMGITCTIAYSGILGMVFYLFIHPKIEAMLWERSVYFQLTIREQLYFVLYSFLIFLCMYLIWAARFAFSAAVKKIRSNNEKTGRYIENAFDIDDGGDER